MHSIDLAINMIIMLILITILFSQLFFVEIEKAENVELRSALSGALLSSIYINEHNGPLHGKIGVWEYCTDCGLSGRACVYRNNHIVCAWKIKNN